MKLKKIVSLALAGVLAVSMLAGCKSTGAANGGASSEAPAATGMVGKVIAALNVDNVTFSAGSDLQKTLDKVAEMAGDTLEKEDGADVATAVVKLNPAVGEDSASSNELPEVETTLGASDKVAQTRVFGVAVKGTNEEFVAEQLAAEIKKLDVNKKNSTQTIADLETSSAIDTTDNKTYYTFAYTGSMAVTSAKDSNTGEVTYFAVFSITRTPTKTQK